VHALVRFGQPRVHRAGATGPRREQVRCLPCPGKRTGPAGAHAHLTNQGAAPAGTQGALVVQEHRNLRIAVDQVSGAVRGATVSDEAGAHGASSLLGRMECMTLSIVGYLLSVTSR